MPKLEPLICTVCGASVPRETLICRYCGTNFVLSEDKVAVNSVTKLAQETYVEGETFEFYYDYNSNDFMLDDRVDRKILKYLNETRKSKCDAIKKKLEEYVEERHKLRRLLEYNQIDEDSYDDMDKESWRKYEIAKEQIKKMLDCGEGLKRIENFIMEGVKNKIKNFHDIKSIEEIVFNSVDGKVFGNMFLYKITGYVDCYLKSGLFSTKLGRKYFSAEVDYKTGKIVQFNWEPRETLNVQEYRARPLPLPKFI